MKIPQRRHTLTISAHADDLPTLRQALEQIARELHEGGTQAVSGGVVWAGHWEHKVNESQTAESYRAELEAYIEAGR